MQHCMYINKREKNKKKREYRYINTQYEILIITMIVLYRDKKDLPELSRLGHFLKGSSAAIGLKKVKETCEKIQNIGNCQDEIGVVGLDKTEALKKITQILPRVKAEYSEAEEYLKNFYEQETR